MCDCPLCEVLRAPPITLTCSKCNTDGHHRLFSVSREHINICMKCVLPDLITLEHIADNYKMCPLCVGKITKILKSSKFCFDCHKNINQCYKICDA